MFRSTKPLSVLVMVLSTWVPPSGPTGATSMPPIFNWRFSGSGIFGGAAVMRMASKGARSGQPS